MNRMKDFLIGLSSGTAALLMLMAFPPSASAMVPDWELHCDFGNGYAICCTIDQNTGEIGDCEKVPAPQ